jgi:hypothetical protein
VGKNALTPFLLKVPCSTLKFKGDYYVCNLKFEFLVKKILYLFLFILVMMPALRVSGQRIKAEVMAGGNLSQVDGDEIYGFDKAGLNIGLGAIVPIGKHFAFSLETLYNQKGSNQGKQYEDSVFNPNDSLTEFWTGAYKLRLNYLEVPFLLHYTDKIISAGVGFSYGRLVNVQEFEHGRRIESTSLNEGPYTRNDYNFLADLNFRIHKKIPKFRLNIRYAYSISKIRTRDFYDKFWDYTGTRDQFNNLFSVRLIYVLNEKAALPDMKKK